MEGKGEGLRYFIGPFENGLKHESTNLKHRHHKKSSLANSGFGSGLGISVLAYALCLGFTNNTPFCAGPVTYSSVWVGSHGD